MPVKKEEIVITATDKTARAWNAVQASAKKTGADLAEMSRDMAAVGTVAVAAAAGLFLLTQRAIANADAIAKTADKVGLGVESLQELRIVADETSNVVAGTLDMAMQRFSRRVGEAVQGQGELKDTLKQYGIAVTDAEGRTRKLDDVLGDYADAIGNAGSEQEKLRLAFKGFDSEGAALVNMFRDGAAGLAEMRQEARETGQVLGEDMVRQAEAADDALTRVSNIAGVNFQRVLISLAPLIEAFGDAFAEAAPHILDASNALVRFIGGPALLSISALNEEMAVWNQRIDEWQAKLDKAEYGTPEWVGLGVEIKLAGEELEKLSALAAKKQQFLADLAATGGDGTGGGDTGANAAADKERARAEALLAAIEATNMQIMGREFEFLELRAAQEMAKLDELHEVKKIDEVEYLDAVHQLNETAKERKFQLEEDITDQHRRELDQRLRDEEKLRKQQLRREQRAAIEKRKILSNLATLMNTESRKAFEVGKVAAIAGASIDAYKAATGAYAALAWIPLVGPALGAVAAAAALAAGFAQVQQIQSTSFGGGGGHGGYSGGSVSTPSIPSPDVPALAPPDVGGPTQVLDVTLVGSAFSAESIRDELLPLIDEALGDGFSLNVTVAGG